MKRDSISEIAIDTQGRLRVVPASAAFPDIYREAMEVHWDPATRSLFSPVPREWTYERWFGQILAAAAEQGWELCVTASTRWTNIDSPLKAALAAQNSQSAFQERSRALAERLMKDHLTATSALITLMLKNLPEEVRTRTLDAVRNGTGKVELRTRVETNETELVLVSMDDSQMLWLART